MRLINSDNGEISYCSSEIEHYNAEIKNSGMCIWIICNDGSEIEVENEYKGIKFSTMVLKVSLGFIISIFQVEDRSPSRPLSKEMPR